MEATFLGSGRPPSLAPTRRPPSLDLDTNVEATDVTLTLRGRVTVLSMPAVMWRPRRVTGSLSCDGLFRA